MTGIKQNTYSTEFKESTVKLAKESRQSTAQTARELGIKVSLLYSWVEKYSRNSNDKPEGREENIYDEVKRLKKELTRVTMERDLLKKATAYFARDLK
jgi:transposase